MDGNLKNTRSDIDKEIHDFFKDKYNRDLTDAELIEVHQSLFYFGRAIYNYEKHQKKRVNSNLQTLFDD